MTAARDLTIEPRQPSAWHLAYRARPALYGKLALTAVWLPAVGIGIALDEPFVLVIGVVAFAIPGLMSWYVDRAFSACGGAVLSERGVKGSSYPFGKRSDYDVAWSSVVGFCAGARTVELFYRDGSDEEFSLSIPARTPAEREAVLERLTTRQIPEREPASIWTREL